MADVQPDATGASDGQGSSDDQKLANLVNAAVGSHLKRVLPKLQESFSGELASLKEMLQGQQKAPDASKASPVGGDGDLAKQLEELRGQVKKERENSAKERRVAREEKAFGLLRSELTGKVRPEALDAASKLLFHADRKVKVADDGGIAFLHGEQEYDLREGVSEWLKSKEAALFVPPPAGGQRRPGTTPARPGAAPTAPANETPLQKAQRLLSRVQDTQRNG